ncbi:MAG: energy transducer TonB [Balneolaceae bacterium]|nr:energy transducer TonB [Balneolaceae bacterium]
MRLHAFSIITALFACLFLSACSTTQTVIPAAGPDMSYQEVPMPDEFISSEYPRPDTWAKYPGGRSMLTRAIQMKTTIPDQARRDGYSGRAVITYVVDKEGHAGKVEALMSPHESITEMYKELIGNLNRWEPAMLNGEPVPQKYMVVASFRDGNSEEDN